jgi:hypothetical protein
MNIIMIVPNVVRRYTASLPEVTNNAYGYFNYDHRVVDERVQRFDAGSNYKGPDDFSDMDYDTLVAYAQTQVNPGLARYSTTVACEDALNMAIRSFNKGAFDGKVNANKFNVLLSALLEKTGAKQAKKEKKQEDVVVRPHVLKQLGVKQKDIPQMHQLTKRIQKGLPHMVREKGRVKIKKD